MRALVVCAAVLAAALCGCPGSGGGKAATEIRIGVAGPITGSQSKMGNDILNGVTLAVDEWNARGGLLGKKLVIVQRDDQALEREANSAARELVNEGVVGVIGHFNSGCTIPASEVYHEAGVPVITPSATNPLVTDRAYWNVFRVCGRDDQQGRVAADFAVGRLKARTASILHDKTTYGQGLAEEFRKGLEGKVRVLGMSGFPREEIDFHAILSTIKKDDPDCLFFGGIYDQAGPLLLQAKEVGLRATFISGDGTTDQEFIKTAKEAAEGAYLTFGPDPEKIPSAKAFLESYKKRFGEVGPYSVYAYDAANILLGAIAKAGTTDGRKIADAIRAAKWNGSVGEVEYDAKGDLVRTYYIMWIVKGGKFVVVE